MSVRPARLLVLTLLALAVAAPLAGPAAAASQGPGVAIVISPQGAGRGSITGGPITVGTTINCVWDGASTYGSCSDTAFNAAYYSITAVALPPAVFAGWAGTCPTPPTGAQGNVCSFSATAGVTLKPTFIRPTLTVTKSGAGSGTVTSSPAGIDCGTACTASYDAGTQVTLTATPGSGSRIASWGGACAGAGVNPTCTVVMDQLQAVSVTFEAAQGPPRLTVAVAGGGTVSSSPAGIACPSTCSATFAAGTTVTLTATSKEGYSFSGWSGGGCSGTGTCVVTLSSSRSVAATFTAALSVSIVKTSFARTGSRAARRVLRITLSLAGDPAKLTVKLTRSGIVIATKTLREPADGRLVLSLAIKNWVTGGSARLTATVRGGSASKSAARRVTIPRA